MSSRVAGAGLALLAAALLVVSIATPVVLPRALSLYGGHPTVNGREREVQDVYVGLYNSGLCNTGGDGTCKWRLDETQLGFRVIGYGELAATGGGAIALIMLGALTLQRSENRKNAARLVRIASGIGIAGVVGMIALGPFGDKAGVPIGIGMVLHVAALISGLVASVIAVRPPPPLVLRTAPTPPPQPVVPQPTPVPVYAPTPVPQLRPLYEAVPVPVTPPPRAVYEVDIDVEPSLVAPVPAPVPVPVAPPPPPRPHPISVPPPIPPRSKPISVPPPPPPVPEPIAAPNTEPTSVPDDEPAPPPPAPPLPIIAPARAPRETSPPVLKPGVRAAVPMPVRAGRLTMPTRPPPLAIRTGLPRPTITSPVVPPPAIPAIPAIPFSARPRVETEDDHGVHDIPVADDAVGEATDASVRVSDTSPTGEPIDAINGATIATPPIDLSLEHAEHAPPARSTVTSTAFPAPVPLAIPAPTPVVRERPAPKLPISTAPDSLPPPRDDKQQAGPSPACPQCESPMAWVEEHLRFYCKSCRMYF